MDSAVVEGCSYLIDGDPAPGEFYVGEVAGLADSGDAEEFAAGGLDADGSVVGQGGRD